MSTADHQNTSPAPPGNSLIEVLPYSFAKKHLILPVRLEEKGVVAMVSDLNNLDALEEASWMLGKPIIPIQADPQELLARINQTYEQKKNRTSELIANLEDVEAEVGPQTPLDLLENTETTPVIATLNEILREAIQQRASDIHFDPLEDALQIRYRIDGFLQPRHQPPTDIQSQLITRIKVLGKLDIAEKRLPQDGRVKMLYGGREIDFRISTAPVLHGERVVLRILDRQNITLGLDHLGMPENLIQNFRDHLSASEGIILVTGPTGSGKTTTLYSGISDIASPQINIMTIEDPVEYKVAGVAQIQVMPKIDFTFAKGLRQILRQDPDVIMVGEIRDIETAVIAVQASLTGHLVFSTLHTNDAPSSIIRLRDMGIEPYLISASLIAVVGQRLVRKLCSCKVNRRPTEKESAMFKEHAPQEIFDPKGCPLCFHSGYKGRVGVYELLKATHRIGQGISNNATVSEIRTIASEEGYVPLFHHGLELVRQGVTSLTEILRVSRHE